MTQMTRSTPTRGSMRNRNDFERWLSAWMPGQGWDATFADSSWLPPVNIAEDQDNYLIELELPGVRRDDIKVTYTNGVLTIQGERKDEKQEREQSGRQYHRMERVYGMFERSFRLPSTVRADRINAEFRDGVLTLTVPKAEEAKPRQITINVHDGGERKAGNGSQGQGAQESASTARSNR